MGVGRPGRERVALAALVAASTIGHAWWVSTHRAVLAVDLDEATLITGADRVRASAVSGWFDVRTSAPLLRTATAASTALFGRTPLALALPVLAANAVLLVAVYAIAGQLGARRWALAAPAFVATAPLVVQFSRSYHQIIPAAAALSVCVAVGLRTEGLARRRWSIVLGACLGVALLTRTMLVAFVPVVIVGLLVEWRARRGKDHAPFPAANLGRAVGAMVAVACAWWAWNLVPATRYLLHGSGPDAAKDSGIGDGVPGERELRLLGRALAGPEAYSPRWGLVAVVGVGVAVMVVGGWRARSIDAPLANVGACVLLGFLVLVANTDGFPGFILLVVPLAAAWVTALAARCDGWPRVGVALAAAGLVLFGLASFPAGSSGWYAYGMEVRSGWTSSSGEAWERAYRWALEDVGAAGCRERMVVVRDHDLMTAPHLQWTADVLGRPVQVDQALWRNVDLRAAGEAGWLVVEIHAVGNRKGIPAGYGPEDLRPAGLEVVRERKLPDGSVARIWALPGAPTCHPSEVAIGS